MRTIKEYERFMSFLGYAIEEDLVELEKEFESIQSDIDIISYTRGKKRFLKFLETSIVFGLRVIGYDYCIEKIAILDSHDEVVFVEVPWDKKFTELLREVIIKEVKQQNNK